MIDWPDALVKDIARRRAIPFLGAGVSKNSVSELDANRRPPDWEEFLTAALAECSGSKKHIRTLITQGDYLTACEVIKIKVGEHWNELVHTHFVEPRFLPADIHRDIFKLDCRIVLTQNVDRIYDTFATNESSGTVYVKEYSEADVAQVIRGDRRCVLKAHGTVNTPGEMVFTREEYAHARHAYSGFYSLMDALTVTHTLLFIGCGVSDPDVQLMLERHAYAFSGRPHYMVTQQGALHADIVDSLRRNLNLRLLTYRGRDHHLELRESLAELVAAVDAVREELARTRDW